MTKQPLLQRLFDSPRRFSFDAAVRVLTWSKRSSDPAEVARFRTASGFAFPPSDILDVDARGPLPEVTVGLLGLTGPSGVLPRMYSELVTQTRRGRSTALHDFLDMLGHRFVAFFACAGAKYRPARAAEATLLSNPGASDPVTHTLLAFTGFGLANLDKRVMVGSNTILHYAGLFALRPRSADRLGMMLSDWLGLKVDVQEFAGAWLLLPEDQRTKVGTLGAFNRLGVDAAIGVRAWDPQARFVLRIGPLAYAAFERLLPDRWALHELVSLTRAYVGIEQGFAINPVLAADEVPTLQLGGSKTSGPRLGWNTWLRGPPNPMLARRDADDALFEAEVIEAQPLTKEGQEA